MRRGKRLLAIVPAVLGLALYVACGARPSSMQATDDKTSAVEPKIGSLKGAFSLSGGFRVLSDGNTALGVNAYQGATDGGAVKLWNNCPKSNSACMWMFRKGMLISMNDPTLAIQTTGVDTSAVTLSKSCTPSTTSCLWIWKKGVFHSQLDQTLMINAWGGSNHLAQLVVNRACDENNPSCTFTLENVPILSGDDSSLGVNAFGGAANLAAVKLYRNCPLSNPDCTWTFKHGEMLPDRDQTLPVNAYGGTGPGAPLLLNKACSLNNTSCTWTLDGSHIMSDGNTQYMAWSSGGPVDGSALELAGGCFPNNPDCIFDTGPSPPTPGVPLALPTNGGEHRADMSIWENTLLTVPANAAHCGANGAVIVSRSALATSRQDLSCMTSTSSSCAQTPASLTVPGQKGFVDELGDGSDNQIVRVDDTLILVHQGGRHDEGTSGTCPNASTCRGAEYIFKSTNCATSWSLVTVLDPKSDGPLSKPSLCYDPTHQAGHDRPELYADPYSPGRLYMTVDCDGGAGANRALFSSFNTGATWSYVGDTGLALPGPAYMTTVSSGRLYIAGWYTPGGAQSMGLVAYEPLTGRFSPPMNVGGNLLRHPTLRIGSEAEGISRIGRFPDGDYVRVHFTFGKANGDIALTNQLVRVNSSWPPSATVTASTWVSDTPTGYSVVGARAIQPDRLEYTNNAEVNPAIVYWEEVRTRAVSGNFGPARVRYWTLGAGVSRALTGTIGCFTLASDNTCATFPTYNDGVGDYHNGSFWYDAQTNGLNFMALWAEWNASGSTYMRTNFLTLPVSGCW